MSEHKIPIPSMIYNAAVGGHVTNSQQIIDENLNRDQNDINQETVGAVLYNSIIPNGMGRIVLKKNDNFKQVVEEQTYGNTIFVIKYDFTLTDNVIIPPNCILKFEGGSISGAYTITGNNTGISAGLVKIFNTDVTLAGTWNVTEVYPEWFGAKGDGVTDDTIAINKALATPIRTLRLLDKVYNLISTTQVQYNVDGTTRNAHIIVPANKIIKGTSTSDYTDNSTLSVSKDVNSDFAVFVSGRQVKIDNLRVISNKNNSVYSCDNLIATQKGIAHLIFNQVHARGCNKKAMDIDCFGLVFELCSAGDCEIAYYIHGTSGRNTSASLISCAAGGCKKNGYDIYNMDYSSLISCSCDSSGFDPDNLDVNNIQHAYKIRDTRNISMIGCGCEGCYKILSAINDVRGLSVISCDFILPNEDAYPLGFDYKDIINFDYISSSKISNSCVGRAFSSRNLITVVNRSELVFEDCSIMNPNNSERAEEKLSENYITYKSAQANHIVIRNNIGTIDREGMLDTLQSLNQTTIFNYVKLLVTSDTGTSFSNRFFINIKGLVTLLSETAKNLYVNDRTIIKNCTNLKFSNFIFNYNSFDKAHNNEGFYISNSTIIFDRVQFISYHAFSTTYKLFKAVNSHIIFKNCSTTPGYNSSKFIKDVIDVDENTIIEFIDNNIGTTSERNNYTPIYKGASWYDTTLNKPVYWTGSAWVDATGTPV